jgi:hypothetical protein
MPNWCENDLRIEGTEAEVKRFIEFVKSDDYPFDFDKIIPEPEGNQTNDWNIDHWGTKWNAHDTEIDDSNPSWSSEEYAVTYHFETAWSPPEPVIKKAAELFPELIFDLRYFECGMAFNGVLRIQKGTITDERSAEYFGDRGG